MKKVLITGATGSTASHAIPRLLEFGIPVRALVHRHDHRSEKLASEGVEIIQGELNDFDKVVEALDGITNAYFCYPIRTHGIVEATAFFAHAALEQGVESIVNMSQISARREAKSHASRDHWLSERLLDRSGVAVTHLRPTFFAEWLTYFAQFIREQNLLRLPFGEVAYAPITAEDQGRVIAEILRAPEGHAGQIYPLYGLEELTQYQVAELLSQVLGREISYDAMEIEPFQKVLSAAGFNAHFIQHISSVAQDCRDGVFSGTNDVVERVTGRKPMTMRDFILSKEGLFR